MVPFDLGYRLTLVAATDVANRIWTHSPFTATVLDTPVRREYDVVGAEVVTSPLLLDGYSVGCKKPRYVVA